MNHYIIIISSIITNNGCKTRTPLGHETPDPTVGRESALRFCGLVLGPWGPFSKVP